MAGFKTLTFSPIVSSIGAVVVTSNPKARAIAFTFMGLSGMPP